MKKVIINIELAIDLESSELTLDTISLKGTEEDIQTVKLLYGELIESIAETVMNSELQKKPS